MFTMVMLMPTSFSICRKGLKNSACETRVDTTEGLGQGTRAFEPSARGVTWSALSVIFNRYVAFVMCDEMANAERTEPVLESGNRNRQGTQKDVKKKTASER